MNPSRQTAKAFSGNKGSQMQLAVMVLVTGLGMGAALASLQVGYSGWAAFGIYALAIDVIVVACLVGGVLIRWVAALRGALARSARSRIAPGSPALSR